jgi:cytochrome c oxidase assembly protein subunit 15
MRALSVAALVLALIVVVAGAYVRLSDAGLGCPDWPFCYGKPLPAEIADRDALAKAWKEMGHRYLAGTLGALIAALFIAAWRHRRSAALVTALVALVVFQATLGMWTVTMLLKPAIVTAHLLGGMATLALLAWIALDQDARFAASRRDRPRRARIADRARRLGQRELRCARVPAAAALSRAHGFRQRLPCHARARADGRG